MAGKHLCRPAVKEFSRLKRSTLYDMIYRDEILRLVRIGRGAVVRSSQQP